LAYRGHRDDQINFSNSEEFISSHNEGNFIELVKFRAETDPILFNHLQNAPKNAKYTSKSIQNELIDIVAMQIRDEILSEIKEAKYYSVIADEVCDVSNKEQFSICIRYVHDNIVKETFLDFVEVERITGHVLANKLLHHLALWGLSYSDMRGQCYDGSSNMSGARNGCKEIVQKHAPMATYTHCAAHRLNLAIMSACRIQEFKSTEACIGEIARFFKYSAKRQRLLEKCIDSLTTTPKAHKLKDACRTRWVERIDSYAIFLEFLPAVQKAMQAIVSPNQFSDLGTDWDWDGETITKANGFLYQLQSSVFIICFAILLEVLTTFRGLTMKLQMEAIDVIYAYKEVDEITRSLNSMRTNSVSEFHKVYMRAVRISTSLHGDGFSFTKPRVVGRQIHRNNVQTSTVEDYYRISLYNEFISHVINEMETRFLLNENHSVGLLNLLPSHICKTVSDLSNFDVPDNLLSAVDFYQHDLPFSALFTTEYGMWVRKWKECTSKVPHKMIEAFKLCDSISYPNIHLLLQMSLTIPITSCESERSFSQLKLLKSPIRSTMSASRLSSLAMLKINRSWCEHLQHSSVKLSQMVQKFAQLHPRKMKMAFMMDDNDEDSNPITNDNAIQTFE